MKRTIRKLLIVAQPDLFAVAQIRQSETVDLARLRMDAGIKQGAKTAAKANPDWTDGALEKVRLYALTHEYLMAENVRDDSAHDGRAWGSIFLKAARKGYIEKAGYAPAVSF